MRARWRQWTIPFIFRGLKRGGDARAPVQYQSPADPASSSFLLGHVCAHHTKVSPPNHLACPRKCISSILFGEAVLPPRGPPRPLLTFHFSSSALQSFLRVQLLEQDSRVLAFSPCSMAPPRLRNNTRLVPSPSPFARLYPPCIRSRFSSRKFELLRISSRRDSTAGPRPSKPPGLFAIFPSFGKRAPLSASRPAREARRATRSTWRFCINLNLDWGINI